MPELSPAFVVAFTATVALLLLPALAGRRARSGEDFSLAIFAGPLLVIATGLLAPGAVPPLYPRLAAALLIFTIGLVLEKPACDRQAPGGER